MKVVQVCLSYGVKVYPSTSTWGLVSLHGPVDSTADDPPGSFDLSGPVVRYPTWTGVRTDITGGRETKTAGVSGSHLAPHLGALYLGPL